MISESKFYKILRYVVLIAACVFVIIPVMPLVFMAFKTGVEYTTTSVLTPQKTGLICTTLNMLFG